MYILGISAYFHDSAACLMQDGRIVAAAQEERFTRRKHDAAFPTEAIRYCLREADITIDDVDHVAFFEKPHLKYDRILATAGRFFPRGWDVFREAVGKWHGGKLRLPEIVRDELFALSPSLGADAYWDGRPIFAPHHESHAASAFFPSPFEAAGILTLDGVGEWATTGMSVGEPDRRGCPSIRPLAEMEFPNSLGMLYSAFTSFLGFKVNSGEYKVMGLAPYGEPRYADLILNKVVRPSDDGSFRIDTRYFSFPYSHRMTTPALEKLLDLPHREPETELVQAHFDVAASIQRVVEVVIERIAAELHRRTGLTKLCIAGGVGLNCVANGKLLRDGPFDDVWIQPAAGDAGGALGACYHVWHTLLGHRRLPTPPGGDQMQGALLGPAFSDDEVRDALEARGLPYEVVPHDELPDRVAGILAEESVVGWFQGRMEFGPRALGSRSILGDARSTSMQKVMNLKIKFRESFRPFAPLVLRERTANWFDLAGRETSLLGSPTGGYDSPYMLLVAPVRADRRRSMSEAEQQLFGIDKLNVPRSSIPSVTHVDYSARVQTVDSGRNPRLHELLERFESRTGVPVLVNTSFNVRGEPIVCTPDDAIRCFLGTDMDVLCLGNHLVEKRHVPPETIREHSGYEEQFALD